jgi:hypothetical protein
MRTKRPENLAEVIEHCRDNGMGAIFCDMAVEWKDCQLQMMSVDGWKPMRVTDRFLNMDDWRLILDDPREVEVEMSIEEDGLLRASSRLPKYINGVNTWMTLANDLTTIRGFVRFTWPEWVRGVVGDLYHPDVFRVWVDKKPNPTKRCYKYSAEFPHEVLATGALFLDYGDN